MKESSSGGKNKQLLSKLIPAVKQTAELLAIIYALMLICMDMQEQTKGESTI